LVWSAWFGLLGLVCLVWSAWFGLALVWLTLNWCETRSSDARVTEQKQLVAVTFTGWVDQSLWAGSGKVGTKGWRLHGKVTKVLLCLLVDRLGTYWDVLYIWYAIR
jgi:hypothetical protein